MGSPAAIGLRRQRYRGTSLPRNATLPVRPACAARAAAARGMNGPAAPPGRDDALVFGAHRIGIAWLGLGILGATAVVMSVSLGILGGLGWAPLAIIWPVAGLVALPLLVTRVVPVAPGQVVVERRLFGRAWRRHHAAGRFRAVEVRGRYVPPRFMADQDRPEGRARAILFDLVIKGRTRIALPWWGASVAEMEAAALGVASRLGLPAWRDGYTRRADGLPLEAKRHRQPLEARPSRSTADRDEPRARRLRR